jgi:RNA-binding protein MEX3
MTDDIDCLGDNRALQTALELSMLNLSNSTYSTASQDSPFSYYGDASLLSSSPKKSQNITQCVAVPSSEHVAEIVGRQGVFWDVRVFFSVFLQSW